MIVGLVMAAACVIAIVDGNDVLGIAAANSMTMLAFGAAAVALLIVAMLPRVGAPSATWWSRRTARRRRRALRSRRRRVDEPVGTTDRRV